MNLEACFTSLRFITPAAEDVTWTQKMKNVLCQAQTYVTGLDHMSSVPQVIMNAKGRNKQLCCIIGFLLILLVRYIISKGQIEMDIS